MLFKDVRQLTIKVKKAENVVIKKNSGWLSRFFIRSRRRQLLGRAFASSGRVQLRRKMTHENSTIFMSIEFRRVKLLPSPLTCMLLSFFGCNGL